MITRFSAESHFRLPQEVVTATRLAANLFGSSVAGLPPVHQWRLRSAGQLIEPIRIGGNTRWRSDEVRQWIADGCPPPTDRT